MGQFPEFHANPMSVTVGDTVVASSRQVSCSLDQEAVILHLNQGYYYGLNDVGQFIWSKIQEPARVSDLKREILAEYDTNEAECERDLIELLNDLAEAGLIEVVRAAAS